MYDARSGILVRLLVGVCVFVWCVAAFQISAFADSRFTQFQDFSSTNSATVGQYVADSTTIKIKGNYIVTSVGDVINNGLWNQNQNYTQYYQPIVNGVQQPVSWIKKVWSVFLGNNNWNQYSQTTYVSVTSVPPSFPSDSDGDGVLDDVDPCIDTPDTNFKVYRSKNICTGSYYFFQVTGECGDTKTFFNPIYNSLQSALDDSLANPDCSTIDSFSRISMGAMDFENWYDSNHGGVGQSAGTVPDASIPDPTGSTPTNSTSVPAKPADSDDPDTQKVIDQIERTKVALEQIIRSTSDKIASQVQMSGNDIVKGLKGVSDGINGLSMTGVSNAIGAGSDRAHGDSQSLLAAINAVGTAIGEIDIEVGSGGSGEELGLTEEQLQAESDRIYTTEGGIGLDHSVDGFSSVFMNVVRDWIGAVQNKVNVMMPESSINMISPTSCLSYGGNIVDSKGNVYELTDYCFDDWAGSISMLGNILLASVTIGSFLSCFRAFRG